MIPCHFNQHVSGLTPCQARRKMATGLLGEFVPKCKTDGSYEPVQSHEGYSWCVDKDGREVNGTRKFLEKPSCGIQPMMRGELITFRLDMSFFLFLSCREHSDFLRCEHRIFFFLMKHENLDINKSSKRVDKG